MQFSLFMGGTCKHFRQCMPQGKMLLQGHTAMPTNDPQRSARIAEYEKMRVTIAGMTNNPFLDTAGNALPSSYLAMPHCMHIGQRLQVK